MADPITGIEFAGSAERPGASMSGMLGCGTVLALGVLTAGLFLVGVWARVAWWFLSAGWGLFDL